MVEPWTYKPLVVGLLVEMAPCKYSHAYLVPPSPLNLSIGCNQSFFCKQLLQHLYIPVCFGDSP